MRRPSYLSGLLLIAAVCGLIDAACFLALGGVFAEIMTGNILLLGFRIGTGQQIGDATPMRYLGAIFAFALGALLCGLLMRGTDKKLERTIGFGIELVLVVVATVLAFVTNASSTGTGRDLVVSLLACAMGVQNGLMRKHGVVDVATNMMTVTFTGLISELKVVGGDNRHWLRRSGSIAIFFLGAILGAFLTRYGAGWPLLVASILLAIAVAILVTSERPADTSA